jgi:hypothetical protein
MCTNLKPVYSPLSWLVFRLLFIVEAAALMLGGSQLSSHPLRHGQLRAAFCAMEVSVQHLCRRRVSRHSGSARYALMLQGCKLLQAVPEKFRLNGL